MKKGLGKGRPVRTRFVGVRFSPEELTEVKAAARSEGLTLSEYIRKAVKPRP